MSEKDREESLEEIYKRVLGDKEPSIMKGPIDPNYVAEPEEQKKDTADEHKSYT